MKNQGQLHKLLCLWHEAGANEMFTFRTLAEFALMQGAAPTFFRDAMGDSWQKWFQTDPVTDTVIPHQVAVLVMRSLGRLKEHWEVQQQAEAVRAEASASFAHLVGPAKKRRAEYDEACMGVSP